jgi:hypothetical protein
MKTKLVANIDDFKLGYWSSEDDTWIALDELTDEECAEKLACSPELVDCLKMNFADLVELVKLDLVDLWKQQ